MWCPAIQSPSGAWTNTPVTRRTSAAPSMSSAPRSRPEVGESTGDERLLQVVRVQLGELVPRGDLVVKGHQRPACGRRRVLVWSLHETESPAPIDADVGGRDDEVAPSRRVTWRMGGGRRKAGSTQEDQAPQRADMERRSPSGLQVVTEREAEFVATGAGHEQGPAWAKPLPAGYRLQPAHEVARTHSVVEGVPHIVAHVASDQVGRVIARTRRRTRERRSTRSRPPWGALAATP